MTTDHIPAEVREKFRILIVEDNLLNQKLTGFMLRDWGFKADVSADGSDAIEKIKQNNYDLILMDIQMPVMDGYEATRIIRHELKLNMPVIALTAHASGAEKQKCMEAGMNNYLTKPVKGNELNNMLASYISPEFKI